METNLPGVYAAGDIATFPGKVKLITTGFGEAATAINNAAQYLNPKASVFPGHSTSQVVRAKQREIAAAA
jgi:pyruvate/2-oxoglutarate dehydrogenase complex dihydrolipoamide dehydrogenase (E3) component